MDITEIKDKAFEFKQTLDTKKEEIGPQSFSWYPYGTLENFLVLDVLLTGEHRCLLDLIGDQPTVDIGCADGDLAFFLETLGCQVHGVDYAPTNYNGLQGVRLLKSALSSSVQIHEVDLDSQFSLPEKNYSLAFFLGVLYHLKNPYYVLEELAKSARYCLISTRIAKFNARASGVKGIFLESGSGQPACLMNIPVAYLLDELELNNDSTNFWIFSDAGLRRILKRTGWNISDYITVGNTTNSDPVSADGDERAYCLVKSKFSDDR